MITNEVSPMPEAFSLILGLATVNARGFVPVIELVLALNSSGLVSDILSDASAPTTRNISVSDSVFLFTVKMISLSVTELSIVTSSELSVMENSSPSVPTVNTPLTVAVPPT